MFSFLGMTRNQGVIDSSITSPSFFWLLIKPYHTSASSYSGAVLPVGQIPSTLAFHASPSHPISSTCSPCYCLHSSTWVSIHSQYGCLLLAFEHSAQEPQLCGSFIISSLGLVLLPCAPHRPHCHIPLYSLSHSVGHCPSKSILSGILQFFFSLLSGSPWVLKLSCYGIEKESKFEFIVILTLREFSLSTSH